MSKELKLLKEQAKHVGISFHPSIGITALKEKISIQLKKDDPTKRKESKTKRNARLRKEANRLVLIRLTNMNPNKKDHPGEIISVSNDAIGVVRKFIPFNAEKGWYIPKVLLEVLQESMYQAFYTVVVDGIKVKRSKLIKEFAIELLPPLTMKEMKDLATTQKLNASVER